MKRGTRYRYVDFAAAAQPGFRNHVVPVTEVPGLIGRYGHGECYASIFHFPPEILLYLAEHRVGGRPSIAGYDGRVWAPFLPLDIDAHGPERLPEALAAARHVYKLLVHRWGTPSGAIHPYFSGAKGFHLLVDTRCFGRLSPSTRMPRLFARWRLGVVDALPASLQPFLDLSIGDKVRLLRLANTPHRSTGLFKVRLDQEELVHARVDEILKLARGPRSLGAVAAAGLLPTQPVAPVQRLREQMQKVRRAELRGRGPHPYRMQKAPAEPGEALCAARHAMWHGNVVPGNRNNVAIRLASAFRLAGYPRKETLRLLLGWNRGLRAGLPQREVTAVVHSAFRRTYPYAYGCHDEVIRQFCPFAEELAACEDYREQHPRTAAGKAE